MTVGVQEINSTVTTVENNERGVYANLSHRQFIGKQPEKIRQMVESKSRAALSLTTRKNDAKIDYADSERKREKSQGESVDG